MLPYCYTFEPECCSLACIDRLSFSVRHCVCCSFFTHQISSNKLGDLCFADTLKVWSEGNKIVLFAEVDGFHFDSREYRTKKQWLQSIVRRVYDCSLGRLN